MYINSNYWGEIKNDAPNKDFYRKYVCNCKQSDLTFSIPVDPDPELAPMYSTKLFMGTCKKCNRFPKAVFRQCGRCTSVFCSLFVHPRQSFGQQFLYGKVYCWNCLQEGYGIMGTSPFAREEIPPVPVLLNPVYVKPTFEDTFGESIDSFLDSLEI